MLSSSPFFIGFGSVWAGIYPPPLVASPHSLDSGIYPPSPHTRPPQALTSYTAPGATKDSTASYSGHSSCSTLKKGRDR